MNDFSNGTRYQYMILLVPTQVIIKTPHIYLALVLFLCRMLFGFRAKQTSRRGSLSILFLCVFSPRIVSLTASFSLSCVQAVRCCCWLQARGSQIVGGWGEASVTIETTRYQHYHPQV